jgi:hypothetical protein
MQKIESGQVAASAGRGEAIPNAKAPLAMTIVANALMPFLILMIDLLSLKVHFVKGL